MTLPAGIPPICTPVEARVLAALLEESGALDFANGIEIDDFTDYRHRAIFAALREVQASGAAVSVLSVSDAIEARDARMGTHVGDHAPLWWIALMVLDAPPYRLALGGRWSLLFGDMAFLRKLARQRAEILAVAA